MTDAAVSAIQKAFHTPTGPKILLSKNAAGMMMTMYRHREMIRDGPPLPSPSKAPDEVTETEDTRNPALMMRSARSPALIVPGALVNRLMSQPGANRQINVPIVMMTAHIYKTTL